MFRGRKSLLARHCVSERLAHASVMCRRALIAAMTTAGGFVLGEMLARTALTPPAAEMGAKNGVPPVKDQSQRDNMMLYTGYLPLAKLPSTCSACSLTVSSSPSVWISTDRIGFPLAALDDGLLDSRRATTGSRAPCWTHASFFCKWPTMSFFRARKAAACSEYDLAFCRYARIGVPDSRAIWEADRSVTAPSTLGAAAICSGMTYRWAAVEAVQDGGRSCRKMFYNNEVYRRRVSVCRAVVDIFGS